MADAFTNRYEEFLDGNYDCADRIVINPTRLVLAGAAVSGIGGGRCTDLKTSSTRNILML